MNTKEFVQSIEEGNLPKDLDIETQALWIERNGNWQEAHDMVKSLETMKAFWVHAYLHRREGDIRNAQYWYSRAGRKLPDLSPDEEWQEIVGHFLKAAVE